MIRRKLAARRDLWAIYEEIGRVMGAAAREEENLASRPCPVCGEREVEPRAVVVGPVYTFRRCRGCAMVYAPRVLRPEIVASRYRTTALRSAYFEHMLKDARTAGAGDALATRLAAAAPATRVAIDVGCGFGQLAAGLAHRFEEVVGLELDVLTAETAALLHPEVPIRARRLEDLEQAPASIDLVTMNQILEHIETPGPLLDAAHRLLRPGGLLWVSVPHAGSLGLELLGGRHPHVATHMHVNLFGRETLRLLLERHGFLVAAPAASDDDPGLSLLDLRRGRPPALLAAAVDKGLRWLSTRARLPSRMHAGAHIEIAGTKPS